MRLGNAGGGRSSYIKIGTRAEFVRWTGEQPELLAGIFLGLTGTGWRLKTDDGRIVDLGHGDWEWCLR